MYFFSLSLFSGTARANRSLKQDVMSEPPSVEASVRVEGNYINLEEK